MRIFLIRLATDLLIIMSLFVFPWWFALILAVASLFLFDNFLEIIFAGFMMDVLYNAPGSYTFLLFTFSAAAIFIITFFVKRNLSI